MFPPRFNFAILLLASLLFGICSGFTISLIFSTRRLARINNMAAKEAEASDTNNNSDDRDDDLPPPTPCQRICRYNANFYDGQICIGCYRDAYEIGNWASMLAGEKSWALMDALDRVPANDGDIEQGEFGGAITREELERQAKIWEKIASE